MKILTRAMTHKLFGLMKLQCEG